MRLTIVGKNKKSTAAVYLILRISVIAIMIVQLYHKNYENVFLCALTLVEFLIPIIIDRKLNIKLPSTLEIIIILFIFSSEILGEVQNFYGIFKYWDTALHTINGFMCAAIGFSMIDILNRSSRLHTKMTPVFVALVAFCFSMTVGVLWEFIEYGIDVTIKTDMQKDKVVSLVSSVSLNEEKKNSAVIIKDITETDIHGKVDGQNTIVKVEGGYLDLGLYDTMKDLLVNFVGAVVFSIIGLLYIKDRDEYKFAEKFMPAMKTEQEIEETKMELARLEKVLEDKKNKKIDKKKK